MNLKAIKDRIAALLTDKSSGIQPEFQRQLSDIVKRIEDLLRDNRGECDIPDDLIKEIARCLVPDIIAFFETEEAKREFEAWKAEQEKKRLESGVWDVFYGPVKDQNGVIQIEEGESMTDNAMLNEFDWYVEGVVIDEE